MATAAHPAGRGMRFLRDRAQRSVFDHLRLLLAGVFLLGGALALMAAWLFSNALANDTYDRLLISAAVQIAETVGIDQNHVTANPPDAAFETLALAPDDRLFYAVRAPDGRLVTGSPSLAARSFGRELEAPRLGDDNLAGEAVRTATVGRYVTTLGEAGWASVVVAQTRLARNALALNLMLKIGAIIVFVSALGFFSALAVARRALQPLARIEQALAARDLNDVRPLDVPSPRETQALVDAINQVMARLADRMAKLQAFVGVAAHQIRTPIAALAAQAELLETDKTPTDRRARADRIRGRLAELGRLTNQLLGHAMVVYRADTAPRATVDLAEVARKALHEAVPQALDRDLIVTFHAPPEPIPVQGDALSLHEGLTNLINNAAVHGAPSRLEVTAGHAGGWATVTVWDNGPGIPPDAWSAAVQPFTAPRSQRPGAGLGLSIANEIAAAHGGRLEFDLPAGGGFAVRVRLPMPEAA